MASPTFSLTDILIRGRQTNSQVTVSGVPYRCEKKIGTPDRRLFSCQLQSPCQATAQSLVETARFIYPPGSTLHISIA